MSPARRIESPTPAAVPAGPNQFPPFESPVMEKTPAKPLAESVAKLGEAAKGVCDSVKGAAVKTGKAVKDAAHETAESAKKAADKIKDAVK